MLHSDVFSPYAFVSDLPDPCPTSQIIHLAYESMYIPGLSHFSFYTLPRWPSALFKAIPNGRIFLSLLSFKALWVEMYPLNDMLKSLPLVCMNVILFGKRAFADTIINMSSYWIRVALIPVSKLFYFILVYFCIF